MKTLREIVILAAAAAAACLSACGDGSQDDWTPPTLEVSSPSEDGLTYGDGDAAPPSIRVQATGSDNVGLSKLRCRVYDYFPTDPPVERPAIHDIYAYYETSNPTMDFIVELPHAYSGDYYAMQIDALDLKFLFTTKIVKFKVLQPFMQGSFVDDFAKNDTVYGGAGLPSYWARKISSGNDGAIELATSPDGWSALRIAQAANPSGNLSAIRRFPRLAAGRIGFKLRITKNGFLDMYLKCEDTLYNAIQFNYTIQDSNTFPDSRMYPAMYYKGGGEANPLIFMYGKFSYFIANPLQIDIVFDASLPEPKAAFYIDKGRCLFIDENKIEFPNAVHYNPDGDPKLKHEVNRFVFETYTESGLSEFFIDDFTVTPMTSPNLSLENLP